MITHKSLLLTLSCGLLLSTTSFMLAIEDTKLPSSRSAMQDTNKTPFSQLLSRGVLLITGAFCTNYLGFYLEEKLSNSRIPEVHRYGLMGGVGAAWLAANYCLIRAAIAKRYWNDPKLFKS